MNRKDLALQFLAFTGGVAGVGIAGAVYDGVDEGAQEKSIPAVMATAVAVPPAATTASAGPEKETRSLPVLHDAAGRYLREDGYAEIAAEGHRAWDLSTDFSFKAQKGGEVHAVTVRCVVEKPCVAGYIQVLSRTDTRTLAEMKEETHKLLKRAGFMSYTYRWSETGEDDTHLDYFATKKNAQRYKVEIGCETQRACWIKAQEKTRQR